MMVKHPSWQDNTSVAQSLLRIISDNSFLIRHMAGKNAIVMMVNDDQIKLLSRFGFDSEELLHTCKMSKATVENTLDNKFVNCDEIPSENDECALNSEKLETNISLEAFVNIEQKKDIQNEFIEINALGRSISKFMSNV